MAAAEKLDLIIDLKTTLQASLLEFIKYFFPLLTGREFFISKPVSQESHFITIARELVYLYHNPNNKSYIGVPPGYGKSIMVCFWVAWCLSKCPDSRFIYISYSLDLAAKHNETIKRIIQLPEYKALFGFGIAPEARGKEYFRTTAGGECAAFGSAGAITGRDAGLPNLDRFSGALIIDDAHKPDEVHSDTMREKVITNYKETIAQRLRGINVPMVVIAQRLHELDLLNFLINGGDGYKWRTVILKALSDSGHALYPEKDTLDALLIKREVDIYTFASQYQQDPQPAGGALYKPEMFPVLDYEPDILYSFITADTAETSKSYNDASVFSFWGIYKIKQLGKEMDIYGLHWIDCHEVRVEPKDLREEFFNFWHRCQMHKKPPQMAAIEKKSTGVTLLSALSELRGLQIREIERTRDGGSKTARFLQMQPYVAAKLISFSEYAKHYKNCTEHMRKITANETHAFDDICDTVYDAVKFTFIDKTILNTLKGSVNTAAKVAGQHLAQQQAARNRAYYGNI